MNGYDEDMLAQVTHSSTTESANLLCIRNNGLIPWHELPVKDTRRQSFVGKEISWVSNSVEGYPVQVPVDT
jgi:hypothetical protein